jgi:hypothetical protein
MSLSSASLRVRLFVAFVALSLVPLGFVGAASLSKAGAAARENGEARAADRAAIVSQLASTVLTSGGDDAAARLADSVRVLGSTTHTGYTLLTKQGEVIVESMPEEGPAPLDRQEFVQATQSGSGVSERDGFVYVATTIVSDGDVIGYASASVPTSRVTPELEALQGRILLSCIVAGVASLVAAWLFALRFSRSAVEIEPATDTSMEPAPKDAPDRLTPVETFKRNTEPLAISLELDDGGRASSHSSAPGGEQDDGACDVALVMSDVEAALNARAMENGVALLFMLATPVPETITNDTKALRDLLTLLVQNAIDVTKAGSVSVQATFDPHARPARRLRISVCDTGSGMTSEELAAALLPLKEMAQGLDGAIEATSTVGEGSSFMLLFPTGIRSGEMVDELEPLADVAPPPDSAPAHDSTPPADSAPAISPSIGAPPPTDRSPGFELAS